MNAITPPDPRRATNPFAARLAEILEKAPPPPESKRQRVEDKRTLDKETQSRTIVYALLNATPVRN